MIQKNLIIKVIKVIEIIKKKPPKNTENFKPTDKPATMRVVNSTYDNSNTDFTTRDVILMPADLFCKESDLTIYNSLLDEMKNIPNNENLWKLWHGDTHHIADDHLNWKKIVQLLIKF